MLGRWVFFGMRNSDSRYSGHRLEPLLYAPGRVLVCSGAAIRVSLGGYSNGLCGGERRARSSRFYCLELTIVVKKRQLVLLLNL